MLSPANKYQTIDEYISTLPKDIQKILGKIRRAIKKAAPDSKEVISYQMPAFKMNGILVYFAAFKNHIGFFPTSSAVVKFKKELSSFKTSKGTIRFPLEEKIPANLISKITKFRLREDLEKQKGKKNKRGINE